MAAADLIAESLIELESEISELRVLLDAFDSIAQDNTPNWLAVVEAHARPIEARMDALGDLVRREVLPRFKDMTLAIKCGGGMGAMAPMVTKVVDSQSINSRK